MASYTSDAIVAGLKVKAMLPVSQDTITDDTILAFYNDEIRGFVLPLMMRVREEFYVKSHDHTIVGTTARYAIPSRAIGGKVRDVLIVDGDTLVPLGRIEPTNLIETASGTRKSNLFYVENNDIILLSPSYYAGKTLRIKYYIRPSELVAESRCGKITAIDTATNTVTMTAVPANLTALSECDFVKGKPQFDILSHDDILSSVTTTTCTFSALPTGLVVGDYVCTAEESPIPIMPLELLSLVDEIVTIKILKTIGDLEAASSIEKTIPGIQENILLLIDNRIQGKPHKIVNRSGTWYGRSAFRSWGI